jgi:MoxR-like ATPase
VVLRPFNTANVSNPALFRSLHAFGGVALLDEAERLRETRSPEVQELLSSLYAGYKRGGCATRCEAAGDGQFVMRHFNVFGPKALACINELPPTLATRCLAVPMFRSPPDSKKPRLRVDADAERWQTLRDALHIIAIEHGSEWLDLPARQDVVPEMSGRNFELWQPLLSIAAWLEDQGARGMLDLLRRHALLLIESSREAATPPDDEALLQALARAVGIGIAPTAKELLATVQDAEPSVFHKWSAKAVAVHLKRYGLVSRKANGRHIFDPAPADLRRVQRSYGIDLDLDPPPPDPTPDDVPYVPQVPRKRARQGT